MPKSKLWQMDCRRTNASPVGLILSLIALLVLIATGKAKKKPNEDYTMSTTDRKDRKRKREWKRACRRNDKYDPTDEQLGYEPQKKPVRTMPKDEDDPDCETVVFYTDGDISDNREWLSVHERALRSPEPNPEENRR